METEGPVSELLRRYNSGDAEAMDKLVPVLYQDLRRIARQRLRFDRKAFTLGTTALVNECYIRLVQHNQLSASDRNTFLAAASETMRRLLVDHARIRLSLKRGEGREAVPIEEAEGWLSDVESEQLLDVHEALDRLKELDARSVRVIELRFFGGMSLAETAEVLGVSVKTVQRVWLAARAWLRKEIAPG